APEVNRRQRHPRFAGHVGQLQATAARLPTQANGLRGPNPRPAASLDALADLQIVEPLPRPAGKADAVGGRTGQLQAPPGSNAHGPPVLEGGVIIPPPEPLSIADRDREAALDDLAHPQKAIISTYESVKVRAGPALVHDLGHALRHEVVRLVADDGE